MADLAEVRAVRRDWIGPWKFDRARKMWTREYLASGPRLWSQTCMTFAPMTRTGTNTYTLRTVEARRVAA